MNAAEASVAACECETAAVAAAEALAAAVDSICTESVRDRFNVAFFSLAESEYDTNGPGPLAAQQPTVFVNIGSMDARRATEVVQITAAAAIYSRMLSAAPAAKIAFWQTLLASSVGPHELSYVKRWLVYDPHHRFPRLVLDHRSLPHASTNASYLYERARHRAIVAAQKRGAALDAMIATHLDALLPALTIEDIGCASSVRLTRGRNTQAAACLRAARAFVRAAGLSETPSFAIGLLLPSRTQTVKRVLAIVDRLAAEFATRRFSVHSLSCDALGTDDVVDIDVMTALVTMSHRERVDHLETIEIGHIRPYVSIDALRRFVLAAFLPSSRSDMPAPAAAGPRRRRRRALSLAGSLSSARHVAAVCSALRYGCPYGALDFGSLLERVDYLERWQCWEWLAFGVFYSRSRVSANAAMRCRLDLSHTALLPEDVDAFVAALEAPARMLLRSLNTVGGGNSDSGDVVPLTIDDGSSDRVGVCVLRGAAKIYSKRNADAVLYTTDDASETLLEALGATTDDRWYCVVVPGVGLGWILQADALSVDWDATTAVIGTDQTRASPPPELALVLNFRETSGEARELQRLIEAVGSQLVSLEVHEVLNERAAVLETICTHCPRLEHLGVCSWDMVGSEMGALVHALERGERYNRQLQSLDLSYNELHGAALDDLVAILSDPTGMPQLKELRLFFSELTVPEVTKLYDVLQVNKTLQCLELELYPPRDRTSAYMAPRNRLDAAFQNEQLRPEPLAFASKAAFLSVVRATKCSALAAVDSLVVSLVFQFAATDVRRTLLWIELGDSIVYGDREEDDDDDNDDDDDYWIGQPLMWY